ncbi:SPFH domain-containing protein [Dickeya chrysanthemi]|uniref:SPFH domain-containing protein n=1 Tax=Dickeya chrysanthemi TaxID=556 RepID=UPI0025A1BA30|nr:SPFH domain-containing protein [Dickeya chrysanthemi]WJM85666.1 SPFH domain-containing protein [Dickeya chrysanthemi]
MKGIKKKKMFKKITIRKGQLGLLSQNGNVRRVLETGAHIVLGWPRKRTVAFIEQDGSRVETALAEHLRRFHPEWVARYCLSADMADDEIGLRYDREHLCEILPPGTRRLYWRRDEQQAIERISVNETQVPARLLPAFMQPDLRGQVVAGEAGVLVAAVPTWHVGILHLNGQPSALLPPGNHGYWRFNRSVSVTMVDTRLQALDVEDIEVLTADRISVRLTLLANWRYSDVLAAFTQLAQPEVHLCRALQVVLRDVVGMHTFDELLNRKHTVGAQVSEQLEQQLTGYGIALLSLAVMDTAGYNAAW